MDAKVVQLIQRFRFLSNIKPILTTIFKEGITVLTPHVVHRK